MPGIRKAGIYSQRSGGTASGLFSGGDDDSARRFDSSGNQLWVYAGGGRSRSVTLGGGASPQLFACFDFEGVRALDPATGTQNWLFSIGARVQKARADGAGNVFSGDDLRKVRKIDSGGSQVWEYTHGARVRAVSPDSAGNVYFGGDSQEIRKLDSSGVTVLWTFTGHSGRVYDIATTSDDSAIVSAAEDGTTRKIDSSGNQLWSFAGHSDSRVRAVAIDDAGGVVYTGGFDGAIRKLDLANGALLASFPGLDRVEALSVTPLGTVVSADQGGEAREHAADGTLLLEIANAHGGSALFGVAASG